MTQPMTQPITQPITTPVTSLEDFFPTYLALLEAGDAVGLGALYTEMAVLTSTGGPFGDSWEVGRAQIVANFTAALAQFTVVNETTPTEAYDRRGDDLAARFSTFRSTAVPKGGGPAITLTVAATEVLALSPTEGWQYLADQSRVLAVTRPPGLPT